MTRRFALAALLLVAAPAHAQDIALEPGEVLETRTEGDLNGDGVDDIAYIAGTIDTRRLGVLLSVRHEFDVEFRAERLPLEITLLGPGQLTIAPGTLTVEDLTGGTTAVASTRRYRFDKTEDRLRLIGLDAMLYSRTFAHDGFELSWNLLNGDLITRELHLNQGGGDAAYDPIVEKKGKRRTGKVWLPDSPDPDALIGELSGV